MWTSPPSCTDVVSTENSDVIAVCGTCSHRRNGCTMCGSPHPTVCRRLVSFPFCCLYRRSPRRCWTSQQFAARLTCPYLFSGSADRFPPSSVLRFDVTCRVWEKLVPMPTARNYLAAGDWKHICAAGGTDGERAFDTVECFHKDLARWHELQSLPTARRSLAAVVVHKTFYAIGFKIVWHEDARHSGGC